LYKHRYTRRYLNLDDAGHAYRSNRTTIAGRNQVEGNLSLFHYVALGPAEPTDVTSVIVTLAVAADLVAGATFLLARRDVQTH
jgi:hypothetical protein